MSARVKMTRPITNSRSQHHQKASKHCDSLNNVVKSRSHRSVSDPGLLNRTAWTNAAVALDHIKKVTRPLILSMLHCCENHVSVSHSSDTVWPRHYGPN